MDDSETLTFLLARADSSSKVEQVTGAMLTKLSADVQRLAAVFCKYSSYAAVALAHTCYILKHYAPHSGRIPQHWSAVAKPGVSAEAAA